MTRKYHQYRQGEFKPLYPKKYVGSLPIVYRGSYEMKFYSWLDLNPNVIEWTSESIAIPYISPKDNKVHRYWPDATVKLKDKNGNLHKYIVEIKPAKQTVPPSEKNRKNPNKILYEKLTYAINLSKWKASQEMCQKMGLKFMILTEKDLGI